MIKHEYYGAALNNRMMLEREIGENSFMIDAAASTKAHTGISSAEENNFYGKPPAGEPRPGRSTGNGFDFDGCTVEG